ncbi:ornithine cyclodeaminase family protein [Sulfobacillus harzensis]|uniref:Ornithine cyclodeaminase family protein n=1 Tax=Sulfobacillus harzensis TaxID=2729629 RepID=A0A7Y0L6S5_9FIRM|nr:ornithine cyclodeaminase family protein [Sulfobacillus harzensis]NMP24073.1 ornithine cyclodeaminase family protein [Sulfobacillus harzensis]
MKIITAHDVYRHLTWERARAAVETGLRDLAENSTVMPVRSALPMGPNIFGLMPAYLGSIGVAGAKLITIVPENRDRGLPSHQGLVALFGGHDGVPLAVVDGEALTVIRTAAASALATQWLARPDARHLAILGAGQQAESHVLALATVRPFAEARVWAPHPERVAAFIERMTPCCSLTLKAAKSAEEAVQDADVICTVTAARSPILKNEWVRSGTHINAVGACRASDRELDGPLVARARFYVDSFAAAQQEAGDYLLARQAGDIADGHIVGELGEVLVGRAPGRQSPDEITIFESLGVAVEDIASAYAVYRHMTEGMT